LINVGLLLYEGSERNRMIRFGIIADDLTGALDTGVQFSKQELQTVVLIDGDMSKGVDVLVIDTESRSDPPKKAYEKVRKAAQRFKGVPVYKKIDSTLRGNLGPELEAIMDELGFEKAVVAPAFPAHGRTTMGGRQLVHGLSLKETSLAEDPLCPNTDYIPALLSQQAKQEVGHLTLEVVNRGPATLAEEIERRSEEILVIDAVQESHLRSIAQVVYSLHDHCLACGSAGLAQELPEAFRFHSKNRQRREDERRDFPVFIVAGSRHQATIEQLREVERELGAQVVEPETTLLLDEEKRSAEISRVVDEMDRSLEEKKDVILTPVLKGHLPEKREEIALGLGEIAKLVVERGSLSGLFLTGGETAIHICRALGISAIRVDEEISPGMPAGTVLRRPYEGLRLVTKAGGFGDKKAMIRAILYLRS